MPALANITVKKYDNATDVIFTGLTGASGDGVAAQWRAESWSTISAFRPFLDVRSRFNGDRTARKVTTHFILPATVTPLDSGVTSKTGLITFNTELVFPMGVSDTTIQEGVALGSNLAVASLMRAIYVSGYAAS